MTATMSHVTGLLNSLGKRARMPGKPDLSPAVGIVNDLGTLVARGTEPEIRQAQAAVAGVREQLGSSEQAINYPEAMLNGPDSHNFLAGALWAVNELMTAQLDAMPSSLTPGVTRKNYVRDRVLFALRSGAAMSPTSIRDATGDASIRLDEVSRALGDMLAARLVDVAPLVPGGDRRVKHFHMTSEGRTALAERAPQVVRERESGTRRPAKSQQSARASDRRVAAGSQKRARQS